MAATGAKYSDEDRESMRRATTKLHEYNEGRNVGVFKKQRVYGLFDEVLPTFNSADDAIWSWIETRGAEPPSPEIIALCDESLRGFERIDPFVNALAAHDRTAGPVYAENTWILANLLAAAGRPNHAIRWLRRTLDFEKEPASVRETRLELARVLMQQRDTAAASEQVGTILSNEPNCEEALALSRRLNR